MSRNQACPSSGVIFDNEGKRNISICVDGDTREQELYTSAGNAIKILFNPSVQLDSQVTRLPSNSIQFMIRVTGQNQLVITTCVTVVTNQIQSRFIGYNFTLIFLRFFHASNNNYKLSSNHFHILYTKFEFSNSHTKIIRRNELIPVPDNSTDN